MSNNHILKKAIKYFDSKRIIINKYLENFDRYYGAPTKSDLEEPIITFYDKDKKVLLKSKFQIIAHYYKKSKVWIWSWSLPFGDKSETFLSRKLLNYGLDISHQDNNKDPINLFLKSIFINSRIKINSENDVLILKGISLYLSKKHGIIETTSEKFKDRVKQIIILTEIIEVNE